MQERAFFDQLQTETEHGQDHPAQSGMEGGYVTDDESEDGNDSEADWNAAREGSISRRPAWRRPSPRWIYPFVVGAVLALGNAAPPRSELYVNLACLAHPPEAPASSAWAGEGSFRFGSFWTMGDVDIGTGQPHNEDSPAHSNATLPPHTPSSAADEWFLRLQKQIYEYNRAHQHPAPAAPSHSHAPGTTTVTMGPVPTGPVPHPNIPSGSPDEGAGDGSHGDQGNQGDKDDPSTRGPPYREIDPALCKKSPTVQAAAAQLTMGESESGLIVYRVEQG